jgi:ribosomal protein S18 acetylase RimI-like enzyme
MDHVPLASNNVEYIKLTMVRENLEELPQFEFPNGYRCRTFSRGEEGVWAEIESKVAEFKTTEKALEHFREEFGPFLDEFESRCHFIENAEGRCIGTATAWYNQNFQGERYGRLHWVGILPDFQGMKLAKPLVCRAMNRLAASHDRAYLTTQTSSYKAINVYLDFGFQPLILTDNCPRAWHLMAELLNHPNLHSYRQHYDGNNR